MLAAFRGVIGRPHVTCLKSCGSRHLATNRSPFDTDQNEDGFMLVGNDAQPSSLRPNLNDSSSTTSDDNWAQILRDVDPPSHSILTRGGRLAMRASAPPTIMWRKYKATRMEQQVMDIVFERVFNMDASSMARGNNTLGTMPFAPQKRRHHVMGKEDLDRMFDEKQEAMLRCRSDQELLQWAVTEVFQEPLPGSSPPNSGSIDTKESTPTADTNSAPKSIHPGIYARIIALLMLEFREKYNNPHLSIAIFDHARRRSIISFVTGCTTPSYNELMRTYWISFRDLQMVLNIAEEMRINGVLPDDRTRALYLQIEEKAEDRAPWFEGGREEVLRILGELDGLTQRQAKKAETTKREKAKRELEL